MITNKKTLKLSFKNEEGKRVSINLLDPKDGVTSQEIEAVMDLIIEKNVFSTAGGALVSKDDIKVIDTDTEDLYDPAN